MEWSLVRIINITNTIHSRLFPQLYITARLATNITDQLAGPKHFEHGGHHYFFSGDEENFTDHKVDWLDGRNICREYCMDLVSLETPSENEMIEKFIRDNDLPYVWSSGRLCNFKGCDREDLQPPTVNGWFWSGSGVRILPDFPLIGPAPTLLRSDWSRYSQ